MKKTIAQQLNVTEFPFEIKDSNGNRLYYERSEGYWNKREYDSNGKVIYYGDSEGYWNKREYDSNGKVIYWEDSNGHWNKREYDSNGKVIYYERSEGYWNKREYGSNGKEIYHERSDGCWNKREYDSNGKVIYYENSEGFIEDNRPKKTRHKLENGIVLEVGKKYGYINVAFHKEDYVTIVSLGEEGFKAQVSWLDDSQDHIEYNYDNYWIEYMGKPSCEGRVVEIDGKKYKLTEI